MLAGRVGAYENAAIVVFSQKGCQFCQDYIPRLIEISQHYPEVPALIIDMDWIHSRPPEVKYAWEQWIYNRLGPGEMHLPTTLVVRRHGGNKSFVGALPNDQIAEVFDLANREIRKFNARRAA